MGQAAFLCFISPFIGNLYIYAACIGGRGQPPQMPHPLFLQIDNFRPLCYIGSVSKGAYPKKFGWASFFFFQIGGRRRGTLEFGEVKGPLV